MKSGNSVEKCELILTEGKGLFENEDLPFELKDLPGVFSSFRRKVEKNLKIRPLIALPEKISCSWTPKNQLPTLGILDWMNLKPTNGPFLIFEVEKMQEHHG